MTSTARTAAVLALVALVVGGTWPYFERMLDANERPRLLAGIALVEHGTTAIDGANSKQLALGPDVARAVDGRLVPNKPPGATLVASGAWLALEAHDSITQTGIDRRTYTMLARGLGALLPTLLLAFVLWRRERASEPGSAHVDFAVLAWLLATPAWANAKLLFGHSLAAALLTGGLLALTPLSRALDPRRAFLGGLACAAAVTVEYTAVFAGPAIAIWLFVHHRRAPLTIVAAVGGTLAPIVGLALHQRAVFGSPWTTGYHRAATEEFAAIHDRGILGLQWPSLDSVWQHLLSPWGGLLVWCPLALLGLLAGVWAARSDADPAHRARHALFAVVGLTMFFVLLGLEQAGGWRVGPRYFVLALPLAVPGLVVLTRELSSGVRHRSGLGFALLLGLFGASLTLEFLAANWFPHLIPHGNPLRDLLWPLALGGARVHGLHPIALALATAGLVGLVLVRLQRASDHGPRVWLGGAALALGLIAAHTFGPASDPEASAEFDAVRAIIEPDAEGHSPPSTQLAGS